MMVKVMDQHQDGDNVIRLEEWYIDANLEESISTSGIIYDCSSSTEILFSQI